MMINMGNNLLVYSLQLHVIYQRCKTILFDRTLALSDQDPPKPAAGNISQKKHTRGTIYQLIHHVLG